MSEDLAENRVETDDSAEVSRLEPSWRNGRRSGLKSNSPDCDNPNPGQDVASRNFPPEKQNPSGLGEKVTVACATCDAPYTILAETLRRDSHLERLCVRCRAIKGLKNGANVCFTPDSTKRERVRANGLVNSRKKRGAFRAPKRCMKCNRIPKRMDSHHIDYTKPDEVVWLCRSCHMKAHRDASFLDGLAPVKIPASAASPSPVPASPPSLAASREGQVGR